ncbi:TPA: DNA cytosine methyltransferase [Candidatus Avacholeplasma faecigallinarum]|nr:DNA cytosine methyltransferase [Candidatus Avacholeplasma faecigallinarum]
MKNIDRLPKADLWTYSFPCTDISLAGKMKGFDKGSNTDSSLLWEVQRLLEVAKENDELPKYLLMENVKNIVLKKFMPLFQAWLDYLDSPGY